MDDVGIEDIGESENNGKSRRRAREGAVGGGEEDSVPS